MYGVFSISQLIVEIMNGEKNLSALTDKYPFRQRKIIDTIGIEGKIYHSLHLLEKFDNTKDITHVSIIGYMFPNKDYAEDQKRL
jgi:hypothetical protein